jgi:hypothetical protein
MKSSIENAQTNTTSCDRQFPPALTWEYTKEEWTQFIANERARRNLPFGTSVFCGVVMGLMFSIFSIPAMLGGAQVAGSRLLLVALIIAASVGFMLITSLSEIIENCCKGRWLRNKPRCATIGSTRVVFAGRTYDWHRLLGLKRLPDCELLEEHQALILQFNWKASNGHKSLPCDLRIPVPQHAAAATRRFFQHDNDND